MKIMIIIGSPKPTGGTSSYLTEQLKKNILQLKPDTEIVTFNIRTYFIPETDLENLENYDAIVIATPLYIDSLPSHVLIQLTKIEEYLNSKKGEKSKAKNKLKVYGIVNCGFYEAKNCDTALRIMRMWAIKSGIVFAAGLGIGGGEMTNTIVSKTQFSSGPLKPIKQALSHLSHLIINEKCAANNFCSPGIPKWFFIQAANTHFCKGGAKKNNLTQKQLYYRIP